MLIDESSNEVVKSADRTLDVIELLASWGRHMSHSEIAGALNIPKSSLTKLLKNLTARDYLQYVPQTKDYRLGEAILKLANQLSQARNLASCAQPVLEEITQQTHESCALNQLKGDQVEVIATVTSQQRLKSHLLLGDMAPLYAVSGGKVILAFLPEIMSKEYLQSVTFEAFTPKTINTKQALIEQLEEIRRIGVAYSYEEYTPGIIGIGVPVLSAAGFPIGSMNLAIPQVRFNRDVEKEAIATLKAAAERLRRKYLID